MTYGIKNYAKVWYGLAKDAQGAGIDFTSRLKGRTTARAFQALSDAMNNPGKKISLIDHFETEAANQELEYKAKAIVEALGLELFKFENGTVSLEEL